MLNLASKELDMAFLNFRECLDKGVDCKKEARKKIVEARMKYENILREL